MSDAKVELGRHLFYDPALSFNQTMACADCHEQKFAFSDDLALPVGSTGETLHRNSMTLTNVAYRSSYTWANPLLDSLEAQALVPLLAEFPVEMGLSGREKEVMKRLSDSESYQKLTEEAFDDAEVTLTRVTFALASFQRTLLSFDSPYDRYLSGEETALSASAKRGEALFFSERAECYHCHAGPDFTHAYRNVDQPGSSGEFRNNALYNLDGKGAYPVDNPGLFEFTLKPQDEGRFRIPTLRNLKYTAPYMHDGSIETLEEVLEHYAAGGRTIEDGEFAGVGFENPNRDALIFPLDLSEKDKKDLVAFLESLSDEQFIKNPAFASPFEEAQQ